MSDIYKVVENGRTFLLAQNLYDNTLITIPTDWRSRNYEFGNLPKDSIFILKAGNIIYNDRTLSSKNN
jgi:hypothetical protein